MNAPAVRKPVPYVEHVRIENVPDPFNPDFLWRRPGLFGSRMMLRDAIAASPRHRTGRGPESYFTHFELLLAKEHVEYDRRISGGRDGRDLCAGLAELYLRDFGKHLGKGEEVRFRIGASDDVSGDAVIVRYGHAVYIPGADERPRYRVSMSANGNRWLPACEIHAGQRITLLPGTALSTSRPLAGWPFPDHAALMLINEPGHPTLEFASEPLDALNCTYEPERDCTVVAMNDVIRLDPSADEDPIRGARQQVLFRVERLTREPSTVAAPVTKAMEGNPEQRQTRPTLRVDAPSNLVPGREASATATPVERSLTPSATRVGETYLPIRKHSFSLVAIALQRLSIYRHTPVKEMVLGFDARFALTDGPDHVLRIRIDTADALRAETANGIADIKVPARFSPTAEREIRIDPVPEAMADLYLGFLRLARARTVPMPQGARVTVGRGQPMLAELRVLDSPGFLVACESGKGATPDRLGLSRKAFGIEIGKDGLQIARLSDTQVLYHLDDKLALVARIDKPGTRAPYVLPPGHHLVAGHYVLRYDA